MIRDRTAVGTRCAMVVLFVAGALLPVATARAADPDAPGVSPSPPAAPTVRSSPVSAGAQDPEAPPAAVVPGAEGVAAAPQPSDERSYTAVRTQDSMRVDGVLDEPVWRSAPRDDRFYSRELEPYGRPTPDPTIVQVAYDATNLYIAFRSHYRGEGPRDDTIPENELRASQVSEVVAVVIDPRHDHSNALSFQVTRSGYKVDVQMFEGGKGLNYEWTGYWDAGVDVRQDEWTAELMIPWGTLGLPKRENPAEEYEIGINFRRKVLPAGESNAWDLPPPAFRMYTPVSFMGHLKGVSGVDPDQQLVVLPYIAAGYWPVGRAIPALRDFANLRRSGRVTTYAGVTARARPLPGVKLDLVANPDFSQVPPDAAKANLDRYELLFPETRGFFSDDRSKYELGLERFQVFYSRRVGLQKRVGDPLQQEVPILLAGKSLLQAGRSELALMNVTLTPSDDQHFQWGENVTVARGNQFFGKSRRVGAIFVNKAVPNLASAYRTYGVDGVMTLFDEHLFLSGFGVRSDAFGVRPGYLGQAKAEWLSGQFDASTSYLHVSREFVGDLGFIEQTDIRQGEFQVRYRPPINNDYVMNLQIGADVARRFELDGTPVFDRRLLDIYATLMGFAVVQVKLEQAFNRTAGFRRAANRLEIPRGSYDSLTASYEVRSGPRSDIEAGIGYLEGEYYGGYQRIPSAFVLLNLYRFSIRNTYEYYRITAKSGQLLTGHRLSSRVLFIPTQKLKAGLILEGNTLDQAARAQLALSYGFGHLSSVSLVVSQESRSVEEFTTRPRVQGNLSFTYGFSPF